MKSIIKCISVTCSEYFKSLPKNVITNQYYASPFDIILILKCLISFYLQLYFK